MDCFLIAALTADGFIGRDSAHKSTRWTSQEDALWFEQKSKSAVVVVMGRATYDTIGKPLPDRITIVYSRQKSSKQLVINQTKLSKGAVYYTQLKPQELLAKLSKLGFTQVAIAGGSSIYSMFMLAGVVNRLFLTIEPILFGQGVKLFSQELNTKLDLVSTQQLSQRTLLLEYVPHN